MPRDMQSLSCVTLARCDASKGNTMNNKTREAWETELLTHEPSGKPQLWFTRKEVVSIISAATARAMAEVGRGMRDAMHTASTDQDMKGVCDEVAKK